MSDKLETQLRNYTIPLAEVFKLAAREYPLISVDPEVMCGAPCIAGTRIPVYMILYHLRTNSSITTIKRAYPQLAREQIKSAIGFAASVIECSPEIADEAKGLTRNG